MGLGQDVILFGGAPGIFAVALAGIAARPADVVVAGGGERRRRPAEAALFVMGALGRRAGRGIRRVLAIGIVEAAFDAPDHVGRDRPVGVAAHLGERLFVQGKRAVDFVETERVVDFPF